jgi:hypothetical protein
MILNQNGWDEKTQSDTELHPYNFKVLTHMSAAFNVRAKNIST